MRTRQPPSLSRTSAVLLRRLGGCEGGGDDRFGVLDVGALLLVLDDDLRDRSPNAIYNGAKRIIRRAGFTPWGRLISNMRATRDSELKRAGFTCDQRSAWLGHDEKVSRDHYQNSEMLVNESDYDRACDFQTLPAEQGGQRSGGTPAGAVDADRIPQTSAF